MTGICDRIRCFLADDSGATAIEYGLIAALVTVGAILAITLTGGSVTAMFDYVSGRTIEQLDNIEDI